MDHLIALRRLKITNFPQLLALPEKMTHLSALTHLNIRGCPELTKRCKPRTGQDWNKIAHVQHLDLDNSSNDSGNIYKKIPSLLFFTPSFNSFFFFVGCIYFLALLNLLAPLLILLIIVFISFVLNEILFLTFCLVNSISIAI